MKQEIEITDRNREQVFRGKICPYCGEKTNYADSKNIYGKSYGMVYVCWPCNAYVGVHKNNPKKALGRLADSELRQWKMHAHACLDPLWKKKVRQGTFKGTARSAAYDWISRELNIKREHTHIGMFNIDQCKTLVQLCKQYYKNNAA